MCVQFNPEHPMGKISEPVFDSESFRIWLEQFQMKSNSIDQIVSSVNLFLKETDSINQESFNRFIKKHPWARHLNSTKYFLRFCGWKGDGKVFEKGRFRMELKVKEPDLKPKDEIKREDLKKFIEESSGDLKWVLKILYFTGCRINEALKLKIIDFDFETGGIIFEQKGSLYDRGYMNPKIMIDLKKYLINVKGVLGNDYCFFTNSATRNAAYKKLRREILKINIEGKEKILKTHNFRRAAINDLLDKTNGNILVAQHTIRHRDIKSTDRYVADWVKEKVKIKGQNILNEEKKENAD